MTPTFTDWLKDTFLNGHHPHRPASTQDHHPECAGAPDCYERILSVVDGEISPDEEETFKNAIGKCSPCYEELDVQMAIREAVQHKVEEKPVPENVLDKIRMKIQATA